jgi:hypothetical protein
VVEGGDGDRERQEQALGIRCRDFAAPHARRLHWPSRGLLPAFSTLTTR